MADSLTTMIAQREELTRRVVEWTLKSAANIHKAGGSPDYFLRDIPDRLLYSMVANDLFIVNIEKDNPLG